MVTIKENLTPGVQKLITHQWLEQFPELGSIKPMALRRRVGPLLISIFLEKDFSILGHNYRPSVCLHNLSSPFPGITTLLQVHLSSPEHIRIMLTEHSVRYIKAAKIFKEKSPVPLDGNISIKQILNAFENNIPRAINELESPALIAAWAGEKEKAYKYLEWADEIFKTWSESAQKRYGGKNWRENMERKIEHPDELRTITQQEVIKHKLEKVPYQDFIDVEYKEGPIVKEG